MGLAQEFKEFAMRGNVVDMAVGIVIGGAFGKIVSALVEQVLMPPIGLLMGGVNFADLAVVLQEAQGDAEAVVIGYGAFVQSVVDFLIVAMAIFAVIRLMNSMKREEEAAPPAEPPAPPPEVALLTEIRDALKAQNS